MVPNGTLYLCFLFAGMAYIEERWGRVVSGVWGTFLLPFDGVIGRMISCIAVH